MVMVQVVAVTVVMIHHFNSISTNNMSLDASGSKIKCDLKKPQPQITYIKCRHRSELEVLLPVILSSVISRSTLYIFALGQSGACTDRAPRWEKHLDQKQHGYCRNTRPEGVGYPSALSNGFAMDGWIEKNNSGLIQLMYAVGRAKTC